jgi:hypothetical protein
MAEGLVQRINLEEIVDTRCSECPALVASNFGGLAIESACRDIFITTTMHDEDVGCKKGMVIARRIVIVRGYGLVHTDDEPNAHQ